MAHGGQATGAGDAWEEMWTRQWTRPPHRGRYALTCHPCSSCQSQKPCPAASGGRKTQQRLVDGPRRQRMGSNKPTTGPLKPARKRRPGPRRATASNQGSRESRRCSWRRDVPRAAPLPSVPTRAGWEPQHNSFLHANQDPRTPGPLWPFQGRSSPGRSVAAPREPAGQQRGAPASGPGGRSPARGPGRPGPQTAAARGATSQSGHVRTRCGTRSKAFRPAQAPRRCMRRRTEDGTVEEVQ